MLIFFAKKRKKIFNYRHFANFQKKKPQREIQRLQGRKITSILLAKRTSTITSKEDPPMSVATKQGRSDGYKVVKCLVIFFSSLVDQFY